MQSTFKKRTNQKPPVFSDEMKRELKELYHTMSVEDLAVHFDRNVKQIKNQAQRLYLTKRGKQ